MRKKLLSLLFIILSFALAVFCITACNNDGTELSAPAGLSVNFKGVLTWYEVYGAESYELRVNNEIVTSSETTYNLLDNEDVASADQYTIRIRAVKGDVKSEWSDLLTYTPGLAGMTTPMLRMRDGKLTWTVNANASKIVIKINGNNTVELSPKTSQYDLSSLTEDSAITVQFLGDGKTVADSGIASVIYKADSGKISLTAPQNVHMEGYELTFDTVYGADVYYLLDVTNKLTEITTNRSDRTDKNFVKAVWAGDTLGTFEDGAPSEVKYYSEGSGTEEDPFMISNPEELRYVEYYESTNQPKYYKFKNDIAFASYAPEEEEEYNNFYNLGSLSGVIDGDGHKLSNSVVYFRDGYSSLFDSILPSGVIKNLIIDNANFRTWTSLTNDGVMHEKGGECSVLAYTNRGTIENITVTDSYICAIKDGAAALVSVNKGTVKNCNIESSTRIYGANEAGGIAIFNSGTVTGCINRANISGETTVGGIVGRNNGVISQCGNEGKISANTFGGGIVGYNYNIYDEELLFKNTVSQCYNLGEISVISYGGGIAGKNGGDGINEVGKLSPANAGIISCYNTAAIYGANSVGGIVGDNYGFLDTEKNLGVANCYSTGKITVDTALLKSTRVFLSLENCSWGTDAGALFYLYYWGATCGVSWPGVRMTATEIDGMTYYYADMNIKAEQLTGVIFNRLNPETKEIWSQSDDIIGRRTAGNLLFKINASWKTATNASSEELIDGAPVAGGIAGFNSMINDCYYLADGELSAGVAQGDQQNKILIGGEEVPDSECRITASELSTLAAKLNAYAEVWADGTDGPVLNWQKGE